MGFSLLPPNLREQWKGWELRFLVLLSLFLQLTLVTLGFRRKSIYRYWIRVVVWTTYLSADSIATLTLGVLSNHLANIKEAKGTIDPKSQITAFWAPFLLLYLGGPDTITAYALEDNELWLRQLARLCVHVGLAFYIYFMALSGTTLSMLAAGMILVGFIKYAERTLCLYLASNGRLRDSMLSLPDFGPIYPRIMEQYSLRTEEGYQVDIDEVREVPAPEDLSVNISQASDQEKATTLVKAYELFKIFKLLFVGLILNSGDLETSKRMFKHAGLMKSETAFRIVEIELGFMYDLLYTKALLLNHAWGIIRWVINLSALCAVLVFFSLQDRKDFSKVDICITFLLISGAMLLEIYSVLLAISSDWVEQWRLQRPEGSSILSAVAFLRIPHQRWSNCVAQFSLLGFSIRKRNRIFSKSPRLAVLGEKLERNFCVDYKKFKNITKEWILDHVRDTVKYLEPEGRAKRELESLKREVSEILIRSNHGDLNWSVKDKEFDQSILIWHIATELCYYMDRGEEQEDTLADVMDYKMSKLVSRYMLYLLVFYPSMLPTGVGVLRYEDTSVDAQKFFEDKLAMWSKKETSIDSSTVKTSVQNLSKKEKHGHAHSQSCKKGHNSEESRNLCEVCHLLLQVETQLPAEKIRSGKSRSVLFDACRLASQLNEFESEDIDKKWKLIGKVWAKFLINAACQSKGYEHSESLSRGGELLSHVWLLMAHLGIAEPVQTSEAQCITKLMLN